VSTAPEDMACRQFHGTSPPTQLSLRLAWAVTVHKSQGVMLPRIRLGLGHKEFSCGLTFVALSRVTSLDGLLFIEKLDWERVRKLGGKFLQLQLEDTLPVDINCK